MKTLEKKLYETELSEVSEREREAVESAIQARLGECQIFKGAAGKSPYSTMTIVFLSNGVSNHSRVSLVPVVRSHDGAGHYKGRGRWREVFICGAAADGEFSICSVGDRGAEEVGASGFFLRPWEIEVAETATSGMGEAFSSLSRAFNELGL
jgi:hypothetical protein